MNISEVERMVYSTVIKQSIDSEKSEVIADVKMFLKYPGQLQK